MKTTTLTISSKGQTLMPLDWRRHNALTNGGYCNAFYLENGGLLVLPVTPPQEINPHGPRRRAGEGGDCDPRPANRPLQFFRVSVLDCGDGVCAVAALDRKEDTKKKTLLPPARPKPKR